MAQQPLLFWFLISTARTVRGSQIEQTLTGMRSLQYIMSWKKKEMRNIASLVWSDSWEALHRLTAHRVTGIAQDFLIMAVKYQAQVWSCRCSACVAWENYHCDVLKCFMMALDKLRSEGSPLQGFRWWTCSAVQISAVQVVLEIDRQFYCRTRLQGFMNIPNSSHTRLWYHKRHPRILDDKICK